MRPADGASSIIAFVRQAEDRLSSGLRVLMIAAMGIVDDLIE
jgi:hypothetical protein